MNIGRGTGIVRMAIVIKVVVAACKRQLDLVQQ